MNPVAAPNLLWEKMDGETLVYDLDRHRVHSLNPTAALLLRGADGTRDLAALAALVPDGRGEPAPEEVVRLGMERLSRSGLVDWETPEGSGVIQTRRQAIRRLALLGLALPTVLTVVTPTPAQAATLVTNQECRNNGPMSVGKCCTNQRTCILDDPRRNRYRCHGVRC